jgi:TonB family protein
MPPGVNAVATHLDVAEDVSEILPHRDDASTRRMEALSFTPSLVPSFGDGGGIGSGWGHEVGNGLGSGRGRGRGGTRIYSARGEEELKVHVDFLDMKNYVAPSYPAKAQAQHIEGIVAIAVTIDPDGNPVRWHVVEGHPLLAEATLAVFPRWHFVPIVHNGEKVSASFEVRVRFTLKYY